MYLKQLRAGTKVPDPKEPRWVVGGGGLESKSSLLSVGS